MPSIRLSGSRGLPEELINGGDCMMLGELLQTNATVGAATLSAAQMTTGVLYRSGPTAGYTDTFDSAANIIATLAGNGQGASMVVGNSFKLRIINSVAFTQTFVFGAGMTTGLGNITNSPASYYRDFLFTVMSLQQPLGLNVTTTNGSNVLTLVLPVGQTALPMGVAPNAINLQVGASISGTGIPAGATVAGLIQGQGGIIGFTISANATATNAVGVQATVSPTLKVDSIGSGTL